MVDDDDSPYISDGIKSQYGVQSFSSSSACVPDYCSLYTKHVCQLSSSTLFVVKKMEDIPPNSRPRKAAGVIRGSLQETSAMQSV